MGVGGKFWDLLRPYARQVGFDFLRDKRVAVDLSFWIVQHETAVKGFVLKPHLRLTFFRTINLFSKFGAYPVFVVDGTPSPLKSQSRVARFYRSSGIDTSSLPAIKDGVSVERNKLFCEWVRECVELLELLCIPVVKAKGEAEALCAQLNSEGYVDACITSDSDAFLFGAKCVIKGIKLNSREPFECYHMSEIEAGLGLKRKHLIAISLLVGNDYDSGGVLGIGVEQALRIVRVFSEDEILERLEDIGKGLKPAVLGGIKYVDDGEESISEIEKRLPNCSCFGCGSGCIKKPSEQKKTENWWIKVCDKIALETDFPNSKIIKLYLSDSFTEDGCSLSWGTPNIEMVVDFMVYKLRWDPSYVRRMMFPMLSAIYLRERARNSSVNPFIYDQYEFHSIKCIKTRYGHQSFVVKWRKPISTNRFTHSELDESNVQEEELIEDEEEESIDPLNEPQVHIDNGDCFLLTDECIELVQSAFPDETEHFLHDKKLRDSKKKKKNVSRSTTMAVQGSITDFYRSTKTPTKSTETGDSSSSVEKKRQPASTSLSKSVRRRLFFG